MIIDWPLNLKWIYGRYNRNISISKGINDSIIVKLIEEPAKLTVIVTDDEGNIVESGYNLTFYDPARNFKQVGTGKNWNTSLLEMKYLWA